MVFLLLTGIQRRRNGRRHRPLELLRVGLQPPAPIFTTRGKPGGFTLLDTVFVLVILGIIGLAALPNFQGLLRDMRLTEATAEITTGLQYARTLAVRYGRPFGFQSNAAGRWYMVYDNRYASDAAPHVSDDPPVTAYGVVLNPMDKKWFQRGFNDVESYQGVTFTSLKIVFYPYGHTTNPGPAPQPTVTVRLGDAQRTITVDEVTGRISVQ